MGEIRWKKGDYIKLGKAVADFNKKVRRIEKAENLGYLPELENYKEIKANILTRAELNRYINSLKRFQRESSEDLYVTEAGVEITRWERKELGIQSGIAQRRLTKELQSLSIPGQDGFSRLQMGSSRAREIEAEINSLKKLEKKTGSDFNRLKSRIEKIGKADYSYKRALTYMENYKQELKRYSNFKNYKILIEVFNKFSNPKDFYKLMSQNELTIDLTLQSDQNLSEAQFDLFLEDIGITTEMIEVSEKSSKKLTELIKELKQKIKTKE